jgi:hypothetical protein
MVRNYIVIRKEKENVEGWIKKVYGEKGVVVGEGMGIMRKMNCEKDMIEDIVNDDMVINVIIEYEWDV